MDKAAAPHMLPAPEGVSEAEANLRMLLTAMDHSPYWAEAREEGAHDALRTLLSALSSERERAERAELALEQFHEGNGWTANYVAQRLYDEKVAAEARADQAEFLLALALECARTKAAREAAMFDLADAAEARAQAAERERDEARRGERNLSEHARKVAHEANKAFGVVEDMEEFWDACGHPSNRGHLTPAEQVSSIIRERDAAEARAEAAEAKVKELLGLLAPFLPINAVDTRDYAELSFGDHQTQAMTVQPDDWIALSDAALRWTQGEGE